MFDLCAFGSIAYSDALPKPMRLPFCRYFLPVFIILYALVFIPKLALDLDAPPRGHGHIRNIYVGNLKVAQNATVGCQVLINILIWFCYISWSAYYHPESFCLLLARVQAHVNPIDNVSIRTAVINRDTTSVLLSSQRD
jgi:hypothetical protein